MKLFLDSSAIVKRYIEEPGSDLVEDLCKEAAELGISVISLPEIVSALQRRIREGMIDDLQYKIIKKEFFKSLNDTVIYPLTESVIYKSVELLESYTLRSLDSIHLSCAIKWECDYFVSADKQQLTAAKEEGIMVKEILNN